MRKHSIPSFSPSLRSVPFRRIDPTKKILYGTLYIKLVAPDQLQLSDAVQVCHRLVIVDYHLDVQAAHRSLTASAFGPSGGNIFPQAGSKKTEVGLVLTRNSRICKERSNKYNALKALYPVHVKFVQTLLQK